MTTQTIFLIRRFASIPCVGALLAAGVLVPSPTALPSQEQTATQLLEYTETLPKSVVKLPMMPVPGGKVKIGDQTIEVKPFWMAKTETVWEAFDVFLASGPPSPNYDQTEFAPDAVARPSKSYILPDLGWGHHGFPTINLTYTTAEMFCRWLSAATKQKYRLPTEAEWELAARGGVTGDWKMDRAQMDQNAWHALNSGGQTKAAGKKLANKFGIHDLLGNVGEWATDAKGQPVLCGGTFMDAPTGISPKNRRRYQAAWQETDPQFPKSRWWLADAPFAGFRIVCESK